MSDGSSMSPDQQHQSTTDILTALYRKEDELFEKVKASTNADEVDGLSIELRNIRKLILKEQAALLKKGNE